MIYAIGDIHGESEKLRELITSLPLKTGDELVFLGDYVDRGPDSSGVIDTLLELERTYACVFLLGNHESMLLDFLGWTDSCFTGADAFLSNGGSQTLASYGYFEREKPSRFEFHLPKDHEDFLLRLKLYHRIDGYLFVHAGLGSLGRKVNDVEEALLHSRPEDLLWNRGSGERKHSFELTIVYGHTSTEDFQVRWNLPFSIGIDTGAAYGGPLTAIRLPDQAVFQI